MELVVLAESERWRVIAKPSGLPVHRSALVDEKLTVVRLARRRFGHQVAPVHRLDRATSGCLLLSNDPAYTSVLQAALGQGEKRYLAMVRGRVRSLDPVRFDRPMKDTAGVDKDAATLFAPLGRTEEAEEGDRSHGPRSSLILATPLTGRYHQVRRHLRDLSHPVLGDTSHGDSRVNRWWRENFGLARLALHCLSLDLDLPDGDRIHAVAPVPRDLRRVWEQLPWWADAASACPELEGAA
ncbi:MAG: pseudouridylate synthase [Myxococcales bacterium]|nr:pseudouridylate synthase [Myxococcales bacterium]